MVNVQQKRFETELNKFINELDKGYLRKMQVNFDWNFLIT